MKIEDIKFRGMRFDGDGWAYGHLLLSNDKEIANIIYYERDRLAYTSVQVLPSTVGQFTGMKDKNGVDVYAGDNLARISGFYTVVWSQDNCAFIKKNSTGGMLSLNDCELEVIGNIHEEDKTKAI